MASAQCYKFAEKTYFEDSYRDHQSGHYYEDSYRGDQWGHGTSNNEAHGFSHTQAHSPPGRALVAQRHGQHGSEHAMAKPRVQYMDQNKNGHYIDPSCYYKGSQQGHQRSHEMSHTKTQRFNQIHTLSPPGHGLMAQHYGHHGEYAMGQNKPGYHVDKAEYYRESHKGQGHMTQRHGHQSEYAMTTMQVHGMGQNGGRHMDKAHCISELYGDGRKESSACRYGKAKKKSVFKMKSWEYNRADHSDNGSGSESSEGDSENDNP